MTATFTSTIEDRPVIALATDPNWLARSLGAPTLGLVTTKGRCLDLALAHLGNVDDPDMGTEVFPFGARDLWAAMAREPLTGAVLAVYEFFAAPTDLFAPVAGHAKLKGKAVATDLDHLGQRIARGLMLALYAQEIWVVPSGDRTAAGAALLTSVSRDVGLPPVGAITERWPR